MKRLATIAAAPFLAVFLAAAGGSADAETSSWTSRTLPQKPEARAPGATSSGQVRRRTEPTAATARPVIRNTGTGASNVSSGPPVGLTRRLGKTTAPVTGENAAFEAFEQGQYLTARKLAEAAAGKNDAAAMTLLGRLHADGLGVPKDEPTAARWYARAADLGDVEAAFALGVLMAEGRAIAKDRATAAELFERAARKGHAFANYNLALLFLRGEGKPENPYRAAMHLRYAAEQGIAAAQFDLASLYLTGHGVKPDAYEASHWLKRAADQGFAAAELEYAVLLLRGGGLNVDQPKAIAYLRSAATKGVGAAQNRLAHAYLTGLTGLSPDPVEAMKWRILARDSGISDEVLDKVLARRPRAERQRADVAAQAFRELLAAGTLGLAPAE